MKIVILCGGFGTRLGEETLLKPKPMVEIGNKPILWHIMKRFENYGFNDFYLALGYKSEIIKDYFLNYKSTVNDVQIDLISNKVRYKTSVEEKWIVNLIETGYNTMTGGRLLRMKKYFKKDEIFILTYGDGVSNIDFNSLIKFHKSHGKIATVTAVRPPVRFGELILNDTKVIKFQEKPNSSNGWINGGFFVFNSEIFDYIDGDQIMLERDPLERLAEKGQLMAYKHEGFWQCMDSIKEKNLLEKLWGTNKVNWLS